MLTGNHALVVMPTGAGKSLIYQFAALLLAGDTQPPPIALVISPLIALMKDQVDSLDRQKIPATYINSTITTHEQNLRLRKLAAGDYRIIYVAPERLRSLPFLQSLKFRPISLLAVDEAHCISEWGHDFRPDYLRIADVRKTLGNPLTVALTATATPQVQVDIARLLELPPSTIVPGSGSGNTIRIVTGFNRPNLALQVRYTSRPQDKLRELHNLLIKVKSGAAIVYTGTRRDAEETAEFIRQVSHRTAEHYHAGLTGEKRCSIQDRFMQGTLNIVVATNAFGMGIDRADVRCVVHFSLPGSLEAYYQEAGRAGRDELPAQAVLLYSPDDRKLQEWFIKTSKTSLDELQRLYHSINIPAGKPSWRSLEELSGQTGMPEVKLKVALAVLERAGAIEHLGDEGVNMLLARGPWDREAIHSALQRGEQHLAHRKKQLEKMVRYAETNACRRRIMLDHFGDQGDGRAPDCCDNCKSLPVLPAQSKEARLTPDGQLPQKSPGQEKARTPKYSSMPELSESGQTALILLNIVKQVRPAIGRTKLAKILKGSQAKDIQKFGYHKSTYYARLQCYSLDAIVDMIDQLVRLGYFKVVGSRYPVVRLTPSGEAALTGRANIPLVLPGSISLKGELEEKTNSDRRVAYTQIENFLSQSHPRPLQGPWQDGWALGYHSSFTGGDWVRSPVGELIYRLKYQADLTVLPVLLDRAADLFSSQPHLVQVDVIIPTPSTFLRACDPVSVFAHALAQRLNLKVLPAVIKSRQTEPQKEFNTLAQKRANVRGAFALKEPVNKLRVLLVDDLFDSGATLEEITNLLQKAGAARIYVLTMTRTIHTDK